MYMYVYLHIVVRTQVLYPLPYLADGVKGLLKGVQQYAIQCGEGILSVCLFCSVFHCGRRNREFERVAQGCEELVEL